jgi:hypothetical protein
MSTQQPDKFRITKPALIAPSPWVAFRDRWPEGGQKVLLGSSPCLTLCAGPTDKWKNRHTSWDFWMPIPPLPVKTEPTQDELDDAEARKHYNRADDIGSTQREIFKHGLRQGRLQAKESA